MKVWPGYGSEHSMNLVMIGRFKEEDDAAKAKEIIDLIGDQFRADEKADLARVGDVAERYTDGMRKLLERLDFYSVEPNEFQQFVSDVSVELKGNQLMLWTDEADVSAFLKVLVRKGARVEVYSAHDWPDKEKDATK
jgi:hypothetical protein